MLKIEKLEMNDNVVKRNLKAVHRGDAVLHLGTVTTPVEGEDPSVDPLNLNGKFHVSRVGTGWMAEVSVACKADSKVDVKPGELTLALTARIRRLVKKGDTAIDISDIFNGTVADSAADAVTVDNVKKACTKGVITIDAAAANEMVEITFPLTKATAAADPDMPADAAMVLQPGEYHIHILSRLVDDPEGTNMPNPTSFTVTRHCKANLDLA